MTFNKNTLQDLVISHLGAELQRAEQAAVTAHETATHEENKAENKYDTLGLEAAYLATGQARRVAEIRQNILTWRQLKPRDFSDARGVELGSIVCLANVDDVQTLLFIGPDGASMKLHHEGHSVQVISANAPLAKATLGKLPGTEISINLGGKLQQFELLWVQ